MAESPATPPIQRDHADSVVDSVVVLEALDRLSSDHRDVLMEIYFRGRSVTEAAEALGVPPGTVEVKIVLCAASPEGDVRRSTGRTEGGGRMTTQT